MNITFYNSSDRSHSIQKIDGSRIALATGCDQSVPANEVARFERARLARLIRVMEGEAPAAAPATRKKRRKESEDPEPELGLGGEGEE